LKAGLLIRALIQEECPGILKAFDRYQEIEKTWVNQGSRWVLEENRFVQQWDEAHKESVERGLSACVEGGGFALGAFAWGRLVGFASVINERFGGNMEYVQLEQLQVSKGFRGRGIGRRLFDEVCVYARLLGAGKLYISAHPSQETQAFYMALGCTDAQEIDKALFEAEPFDRHLEYIL
jgi:GNAT superfamily N-acetyltransferase